MHDMKLDIERIDQDLTVIDKLNALATRGLISHEEKEALIVAVRNDIIDELTTKPEPPAAPAVPAAAEPAAPVEPEVEDITVDDVDPPKAQAQGKSKGGKK